MLKHRVCHAEWVDGANGGAQTGRQDADGGRGGPLGTPHLVLLKSALVTAKCKVTGTWLHEVITKIGNVQRYLQIAQQAMRHLCVCVHTSREWTSKKGMGLPEPLKSCDQISDTLVLTCCSSRMGTANSVSSALYSVSSAVLQNQALAVTFLPPS